MSTDRQWFVIVLQADRYVHGTEEELQVDATFDRNQRPELMSLYVDMMEMQILLKYRQIAITVAAVDWMGVAGSCFLPT